MKLKLFFLLLLVGFLPALPAASLPPVGFVDVLNKDSISGWAKDPDNSNVPISVHVYCYPRHSRKALWGISLKADKYRSDLGAHGFVLSDSRYKDLPDGEYEIIVYAIGRDKTGSVDNQNVALKLSQVGREVNPTRQLIKKDTFANGKYLVFSQYLGILWDEAGNYDMYQSAVRLGNGGTVYNYYTRKDLINGEAHGETVFLRTSPNGITNWSNATRVVDRGVNKGDLDSGLIADPNVTAVQEGDHYRLWMHYTGRPDSNPNYVFQATTTNQSPYHFVKRTDLGNTLTALPLYSPSNYYPINITSGKLRYGAGQPSVFRSADGRWQMYFTDTSLFSNMKNSVIHKSGGSPVHFWRDNDPSTYIKDQLGSPVATLNTSEFTYYPNLKTYAAVHLYHKPRIYAGSTPTSFYSDPGYLVYDTDDEGSTVQGRWFIAEGGLLRGVNGHITTNDNSTIGYYGAGYDPYPNPETEAEKFAKFSTTGAGATRFYLYKL